MFIFQRRFLPVEHSEERCNAAELVLAQAENFGCDAHNILANCETFGSDE